MVVGLLLLLLLLLTLRQHKLPLRLPGLLLEPAVNRLRYGRLHQVDVAHDLRSEHVTKVTVKLASVQTLYKRVIIADVIVIKIPVINWISTGDVPIRG